jgi:hypothetical protein
MSATYQETTDITNRLLNVVGMLSDNPTLIQDTVALVDRINAAVKVEVDNSVEILKVQKDGLAAVCRTLKCGLDELLKDRFLWENTNAGLENEVNRLVLAHKLVLQSKPTIKDFPTQAELDEWQRKEKAALAKIQDKRRDVSEHQANMALWTSDVTYKRAEFDKAVGEYAVVHKRINALLGLPADEDNPSSNSFTMK